MRLDDDDRVYFEIRNAMYEREERQWRTIRYLWTVIACGWAYLIAKHIIEAWGAGG